MFVTTDGGKNWKQHTFELRRDEKFTSAAWSVDGTSGLIASNVGSAWLTQNDGRNWIFTRGFDHFDRSARMPLRRSASIVAVAPYDQGYIADTAGGYYVLTGHPSLNDWNDWSLGRIRNVMSQSETLKNSTAFLELVTTDGIGAGFDDDGTTGEETPTGGDGGQGNDGAPGDGNWALKDFLDDVTVMRIVTVAVVFFLAQVLIRLYQYSLRLSGFWDSRADAVLLNRSFADDKSKSFDILVNALSPDAYDFKPPPRSPLDGFLPTARRT